MCVAVCRVCQQGGCVHVHAWAGLAVGGGRRLQGCHTWEVRASGTKRARSTYWPGVGWAMNSVWRTLRNLRSAGWRARLIVHTSTPNLHISVGMALASLPPTKCSGLCSRRLGHTGPPASSAAQPPVAAQPPAAAQQPATSTAAPAPGAAKPPSGRTLASGPCRAATAPRRGWPSSLPTPRAVTPGSRRSPAAAGCCGPLLPGPGS